MGIHQRTMSRTDFKGRLSPDRRLLRPPDPPCLSLPFGNQGTTGPQEEGKYLNPFPQSSFFPHLRVRKG